MTVEGFPWPESGNSGGDAPEKGRGYRVTGELKSFDSAKYGIEVKSLGTMSLDGACVECIGGGCLKGPFHRSAGRREGVPADPIGRSVASVPW
jgi:hypothetical protein